MEVIKLEDIILHTTGPRIERREEKTVEEDSSSDSSDSDEVVSNKKQKLSVPRGRPKSGKAWKERKSRYVNIL
jgi:hypothetical protein